MRHLALCLILISLHFQLPGQQQTCLRLRVLEEQSGEPIAGAIITARGTSTGAFSDVDGSAEVCFEGRPDTVLVSSPGFLPYVITDLSEPFIQMEVNLTFEHHCPPPVIVIEDRTATAQGQLSVEPRQLSASGGMTPAEALNLLPGVQMDERGAGGSRRLSIRGSQVRSPFGMRNIRTYLESIPLTSPDGTTPAEYLDVDVMGPGFTLVKGPPGGRYGPGTAGLILLSPWQWHLYQPSVQGGLMADASQQMLRATASAEDTPDEGESHLGLRHCGVKYAGQLAGGYRDHEANQRHLLLASAMTRSKSLKHALKLTLLAFQGHWQLPGALTQAEWDSTPTAALPYSQAMDAHVKKASALANLRYVRTFNDKWAASVQGYFSYADKANPYGTSPFNQGYKKEKTPGAGGSLLAFRSQEVALEQYLTLEAGGEYQWEGNQYREFANDSGSTGVARWDMQQQAHQGFAFLKGSFAHNLRGALVAEASLHTAGYRIHDHRAVPGAADLSGRITYGPQWQQSLGAEWSGRSPYWRVRGRWARGFSTPSLWEVFLPQGQLLTSLRPEVQWQRELAVTCNVVPGIVRLEVVGYHATLRDMILPQTDTLGVTRYLNAGRTRQQGLELLCTATRSTPWVHYLLTATAGLQDYRHLETLSGMEGNAIPGTAALTSSLFAEYGRNRKVAWMLRCWGRYQGATWLNDANTAKAPAYVLLNASFQLCPVRMRRLQRLTLDGGVSNVLDTQWNAFLNLNAANGRYFNPASGRSYWLGLRFNLRHSNMPFTTAPYIPPD